MLKLFSALALLAISLPASAFDCAKAGNPTEKLICATPALVELDAKINEAYNEVLKSSPPSGKLEWKKRQREHIARRNECLNKPAAEPKICAKEIRSEMEANLRILEARQKDLSFPNPLLLDYKRVVSFGDEFDRRSGLPQSEEQGDWSSSCQPHNCLAKAFEWSEKSGGLTVRAIAEAAVAKCKGTETFYVVASKPVADLPAGAVAALKAWAEKDEVCAGNALWYHAEKQTWVPAVPLGNKSADSAKAVNEAIAKTNECGKKPSPPEQSICRSPKLADAFRRNEEARAQRPSSLPKDLRADFEAASAKDLQKRDACYGLASGPTIDQCLAEWAEKSTADLKDRLEWRSLPEKQPPVDLSDWQKLSGGSIPTMLDLVGAADAGTKYAVDARSQLEVAGKSTDIPADPAAKTALKTTVRKVRSDARELTIEALTLKVEPEYNGVQWKWMGVFAPATEARKARLAYVLNRDALTCGNDDPFAIVAAKDDWLEIKEQLVESCGSMVLYDFRTWRCGIQDGAMACFVLGRSAE